MKLALMAVTAVSLVWPLGAAAQTAITKQDEDAMNAVFRVFVDRVPIRFIVPSLGPSIVLRLKSPEFGQVLGSNFVLYRIPRTKCAFEFAELDGDTKNVIAQIDFNQLSEEYHFDGHGYLVVVGVGKALCQKMYSSDLTCFSKYVSAFASTRDQTLRAFRYIFSNVCAPYQIPVN